MTPLRWTLAVSGWVALAAAVFLPDAGVARVLLTTVFLVVCPGLAAARWARPERARATDRTALLETAVLAVLLSMALATLIAEVLFLSGLFTAIRALIVLAVVTSALTLLPRPAVRRRAPE